MGGLTFERATKKRSRLRMTIDGPSGAGKTYTALTFAFALGSRVAVIDTERGSASKYADVFPAYDVLELATFGPDLYTRAIQAAGEAGYDVLVIDSLSHAWEGEGGALDLVDQAAARGRDNSYTAWRNVTPLHRRMVDAILQSPCHVITTMRSKTEYVLELNERGKQVPRKVGMAPIQRAGMEYEFDVVADMDLDHRLMVSKSRCSAVDGVVTLKPTGEWMKPVIAWLQGAEPEPRQERAQAAEAEPEAEQQAPSWADDGEKRDMIVTRAANKYELTIEEVLRIMPPVGEWRDLYPTGKDCMADFEKRFAQAIAHPTETDYHALAEAARKEIQAKALTGSDMAASEAQRNAVVAALSALTPDVTPEAKSQQRHLALVYLFGKRSSKALTSGEASAVIDRYSIKSADGQWLPREDRRNEFLAVVRTQQEIEGQQRLV